MGAVLDSVYVLEGSNAVKVGVAQDPTQRLRQLQTGNPDRLRLAWSMPIAGDAYAVEAEAKAILDRHRLVGEWFSVPAEVAVAAVSGAAYRAGVHPPGEATSRKLPNWPRRIALIGLAFAPGWAAMTAGIDLLAFPLLFLGLVALSAGLLRSQRAFGMGATVALGWFGAIVAGMAASIVCGLIVGSAHAADRPAFPSYDSDAYCSKVVALLNDNPLLKEGCRSNEADARTKLRSVWADPPADIEIQCMKLMGLGSPNNYQAMSGCVALGVGNSWLNGTIKLAK